jgi:hypothetical protein
MPERVEPVRQRRELRVHTPAARRSQHRVLLPAEGMVGDDDVARLVVAAIGAHHLAYAAAYHQVAGTHARRIVFLRADAPAHVRRHVEIDCAHEHLVRPGLGCGASDSDQLLSTGMPSG